MKLETKIKWAITLSIMAIASVITCVTIWACKNLELKAISLEVFIGVIVALLAVIVTFVVAWQINNTLEINKKIEEQDRIKQSLEEQKSKIDRMYYDLKHSVSISYALNAETSKDFCYAFCYYVRALENALISNNFTNVETLLFSMERCAKSIAGTTDVDADRKWFSSLKESHKNIQTISSFLCIKLRYENIINVFINNTRVDIDNN